ncbi:MAG: hypothetical protein ACK555_17675 [Acidobacteriota bacterium]
MFSKELLASFPQPLGAFSLLEGKGGRFPGIMRPDRAAFTRCKQAAEAEAGWLLYAGFGAECHAVAQDLSSQEGSYWHAIHHRMEPDAWNSKYWFRQVGSHPLYPALAEKARQAGWSPGPRWEPARFVDFVLHAIEKQDEPHIELAESIQFLEWRLLFEFCVSGEIA